MSELRIMDLEDALQQAIWTIQFLHGCLTEPTYSYEYPEQTQQRLEEMYKLLPENMPWGCVHSYHDKRCSPCKARMNRQLRRKELENE